VRDALCRFRRIRLEYILQRSRMFRDNAATSARVRANA